jgi:RING-box protein 1
MDESKDVIEKEEVDQKEDEGSSGGPRFEIKKWNAVTMWSWDICADTCAICRNSLNEPSIEYQVIIYAIYISSCLLL